MKLPIAQYPEPVLREPLSSEDQFRLKAITRIVIGLTVVIVGAVGGCAISNAGPTEQELCYKAHGNWTWAPDNSDDKLTYNKTCVIPAEE